MNPLQLILYPLHARQHVSPQPPAQYSVPSSAQGMPVWAELQAA